MAKADRMTDVLENETPYAAAVRDTAVLSREEPAWVTETRRQAMDAFDDLGFPTTQDEQWRFTNVAPLVKIPFRPALHSAHAPEAIRRALPKESGSARLVFINGRYSAEFSQVSGLPSGVRVGSLALALRTDEAWLRPYLARSADYRRHAFTALNTALWEDGAFVHVPKGAAVAEPIELVFLSSGNGDPAVCYPRTLVVAERDAQATLVESYIGLDEGVCFSNAVTEIIAGENAVLDHYQLQRENEQSFHVGMLQVYQSHAAQFSSCSLSLGGALVRNEVTSVLDAEGAGCTLNGLFLGLGHEHVDHHTLIDHAKPHGSSRQLYNGILGGHASAVFNGGILVRANAQKTDAIQRNRNLLLSPDATIDSKPQLEISANDVRCTHGATIGQMDAEALFYLRSRGVGQEQARQLLIHAFASEVLDRVRVGSVRHWVEEVLRARLDGGRNPGRGGK